MEFKTKKKIRKSGEWRRYLPRRQETNALIQSFYLFGPCLSFKNNKENSTAVASKFLFCFFIAAKLLILML